jgi:hypothetical protein
MTSISGVSPITGCAGAGVRPWRFCTPLYDIHRISRLAIEYQSAEPRRKPTFRSAFRRFLETSRDYWIARPSRAMKLKIHPPMLLPLQCEDCTVGLRWSLSSGVLTRLALAAVVGPDVIARYALPLTSKVIGGAQKPEPLLIFRNSPSVVSSNAAAVRKETPITCGAASNGTGVTRATGDGLCCALLNHRRSVGTCGMRLIRRHCPRPPERSSERWTFRPLRRSLMGDSAAQLQPSRATQRGRIKQQHNHQHEIPQHIRQAFLWISGIGALRSCCVHATHASKCALLGGGVAMGPMLSLKRHEYSVVWLPTSPPVDATMPPVDLKNYPVPSNEALPRRGDPCAISRFLVAFCIGATVTLAWQSCSDAARQLAQTSALRFGGLAPIAQPTPNVIAPATFASRFLSDQHLAAVQENVDRHAVRPRQINIDIDSSVREQTTRNIASQHQAEPHTTLNVSVPLPRPAPAETRKHASRPATTTADAAPNAHHTVTSFASVTASSSPPPALSMRLDAGQKRTRSSAGAQRSSAPEPFTGSLLFVGQSVIAALSKITGIQL